MKEDRVHEIRSVDWEELQVSFPEAERVVYERNPLEGVKGQVTFPPILAIEASTPAQFQEAVRANLPYYESRTSIRIPAGVPAGIAKVVETDLSRVGGKSHVFSSEDRDWSLELNKNSISLTCRRYERWEAFRSYFEDALQALDVVYQPSFFRHVCVRYKNSIRPELLGLNSAPWSDLLQPWASGPLDQRTASGLVKAFQSQWMMELPDDNGRVEAKFALAEHQPSRQSAFIIESHVLHDGRKERTDVLPRLDALHEQAGHFFRWCITDKLHRAMRPRAI